MQILLPYFSIWGIPVVSTVTRAKQLGFAGLEVLLTRNLNPARINRLRRLAQALGLKLHFHQCWSLQEYPTLVANHTLSLLGLLPKAHYRLQDQTTGLQAEPIICFPDRFSEIAEMGNPPNFWLQTAFVLKRSGNEFEYKLPYLDFRKLVETFRPPLVFDTQHFLEFSTGATSPADERIPRDRRTLLAMLEQGWKTFKPYVREIHLCDCNPSRGHAKGRNVFLGEGILPLRDFCQLVKASGWEGPITPEVQPAYLRYYRLGELRQRVLEFFQ